ncbi:hypothetical protein H0H81_012747 [Sphagnurus paluster]|uniref:Uncharacterized protein n=1 Tax=Sphagnurus paluster TaxID=117069 RepID=A0A9P7K838_9AGAR|nr:hypothetical protein H0H81_012747 [Sphagnurus paluster]
MLQDTTLSIPFDILDMPSSFGFPWNQLTRLIMESVINFRIFNNIIIQCRNLVHGSFTIDVDLWSDRPTIEILDPIVFPNLLALQLRVNGVNDEILELQNTMRMLVFPSIKLFELSYSGLRLDLSLSAAVPSLYPHSTVSTIPLTCLVLANVMFIPVELLTLLGACTALEKFAFEPWSDNIQEILADLVEPSCDIPVPSLPNLTSFALVIDHGDFRIRALLQTVANLVQAWASNPERRRPLESIMVYNYENNPFRTGHAILVLEELRDLLGPWTWKDDCLAIAESGMVLQTRVVSDPFSLSKELDWFKECGSI